jgi:hypothetical protein
MDVSFFRIKSRKPIDEIVSHVRRRDLYGMELRATISLCSGFIRDGATCHQQLVAYSLLNLSAHRRLCCTVCQRFPVQRKFLSYISQFPVNRKFLTYVLSSFFPLMRSLFRVIFFSFPVNGSFCHTFFSLPLIGSW